ncbi:MAG TPA: hypothetical protein VMG10_12180 [Gemmataceae bacterium]|nr:hypothetical protein [Gemmataceae bacterium]
MSIVTPPNVRYVILCHEALADPEWPGRVRVIGLIPELRWPQGSTTPFHLERLTVLLVLAGGRGAGQAWIDCIDDETGTPISTSGKKPIEFKTKDPLEPFLGQIKLRSCYFPRPGWYRVRFLLDDNIIAEQMLIVR